MKLPSSAYEGALPLDRVLRTLHDHMVTVKPIAPGVTHLEKADIVESQCFPPTVARYIIQRLARLFEIPITEFYKPSRPSGFFAPDDDSDKNDPHNPNT